MTSVKKKKQIKITMTEYNEKMDKIIKMNLPVEEALIMMLEEAGKYHVKGLNPRKIRKK